MITAEVRSMKMKRMLKKLFSNYGLQGAKAPSLRGCYEAPVPIAAITRLQRQKNHRSWQKRQMNRRYDHLPSVSFRYSVGMASMYACMRWNKCFRSPYDNFGRQIVSVSVLPNNESVDVWKTSAKEHKFFKSGKQLLLSQFFIVVGWTFIFFASSSCVKAFLFLNSFRVFPKSCSFNSNTSS